MTQQKTALACLLVCLIASAVQASDLGKFQRPIRRALQQRNTTNERTPEDIEAEREAAALASFAEEQERMANESALMIQEARVTAAQTVQDYLNSTIREQIGLFVDLLRNADGLAFKFALNTLSSIDNRTGRVAMRHAHRAIGSAIQQGFASNVAQAVSYAFTIRETDNDHVNLLDAIDFRRGRLEASESGAGCTFIKNLFTDADTFAYQRSASMAFIAAFDANEYLHLMECFLDACSGRVARCCGSGRAIRNGRCGCQGSDRCAYNIFANRPRTIWICSTSSCGPNEKCMCSAEE